MVKFNIKFYEGQKIMIILIYWKPKKRLIKLLITNVYDFLKAFDNTAKCKNAIKRDYGNLSRLAFLGGTNTILLYRG